jgi:hypothetical protein
MRRNTKNSVSGKTVYEKPTFFGNTFKLMALLVLETLASLTRNVCEAGEGCFLSNIL